MDNFQRQVHFWAHMLDECFHKDKFLTEGKHWPEDYVKTAVNMIKNSQLTEFEWYDDEQIKEDVEMFVETFKPLSHKSSNLGFFSAVIRWFIEYVSREGINYDAYEYFIDKLVNDIVAGLLMVRADREYDARAEEIKKMSFSQFMKLVNEVKSKQRISSIRPSPGAEYEVVPIYSYAEMNEKYGGDKTGWHGQSEWCHTNGEDTYDIWTKDGTQMFFVIQRRDWKSIRAPEQKPDDCYDEYGMSLIAILVDIQTGSLLKSTSRWNHVVLPSTGAADTMFESWEQLNRAVGIDVKSICDEELKGVKERHRKIEQHADEEFNQLLRERRKITASTVPDQLKCHLMHVVIPDSIESIGDNVFEDCLKLTSVAIPDSVTDIGAWAFAGCTNLERIVIPGSVTSIGNGAFWNCKSIAFSEKTLDKVKSMRNYPWGADSIQAVDGELNFRNS